MLELRVQTAQQEYVYTSDSGLLAGDVEIVEAVEEGEIALGDVSLGLAAPFLGAAGRAELPGVSVAPRVASGAAGGGYRAVLRRNGEPVLDGVIPRADLALDRRTRAWTVPLVAGSADDLWTRLEKVRLGNMLEETVAGLPWHAVPSVERNTDGGGSRYFQGAPRRWYSLPGLLTAVLAEAGRHGVDFSPVTLEGALPVLRYGVRYLAHGDPTEREFVRSFVPLVCATALYDEVSGYTRTSLTLPDWSGRELAEAALATLGWRFAVRYATYPSTELLVRVVPDVWVDRSPDTLPALDGREAAAGVTERLSRTEATSFAVQFAGEPRPASPAVRMPTESPTLADTEIGERLSPSPPEALIAPDVWQFEPAPRQAEPVTTMERVVSLPFQLPAIAVTHAVTAAGGVSHPGYSETERTGLPLVEPGGVYLGVRTFRGNRLFYRLDPAAPAPGQAPMVHPLWAASLYAMRALSRQPLETIQGDFYVHGLGVRVGDDVAYDGRHWVVRERRVRLADDGAALTLARPAGVAPPVAARPSRTGRVQGLTGRIERTIPATGAAFSHLVLAWRPPPIDEANVLHYEVETIRSDAEGPGRVAVTSTVTVVRYMTGEPSQRRVRAVGTNGPGPWTTIQATVDGGVVAQRAAEQATETAAALGRAVEDLASRIEAAASEAPAVPPGGAPEAVDVRKSTHTVGNGLAHSFELVHTRATRDLVVSIRSRIAPFAVVQASVTHHPTVSGTIVVTFDKAPDPGEFAVTIIG